MKQVIKSVREFVGPVAFFKTAIIVPSLPKVTRSKIRKRNYYILCVDISVIKP